MVLLVSLGLAAEPGGALPSVNPSAPGVPAEQVVSWSTVGLAPAGPESAAFGPDRLAIGPGGAWAVWDPVGGALVGSFGRHAGPAPDGLAFAPDGDLLVLLGRTLTRLPAAGGDPVGATLPGLVPAGVTLAVWDGVAVGVDVFGNGHPLADVAGVGLPAADGPRLLSAPHTVTVAGGVVRVDGEIRATGALAARALGDCAVVERGARGAVHTREVVCPEGTWTLPVDGVYRPSSGIATEAGGDVAWLDPRADGLHVVRVAR